MSLVETFAIVQCKYGCCPSLDPTRATIDFFTCFCLVLCLELSTQWLMLLVSSSSRVGDVRVLYLKLSKEGLYKGVPPLSVIDLLFLDSVE